MSIAAGITQPVRDSGIPDRAAGRTELQNRADKTPVDRIEEKLPGGPFDDSAPAAEYVPGDQAASEGLYRLSKDQNGRPGIIYRNPARQGNKEQTVPEKADSGNKPDGGNKAEECTANTDQVDAEIKRLKEKKGTLERQIVQAGDDSGKQEELERKLRDVERELGRKDNDNYRKQHSVFTNA